MKKNLLNSFALCLTCTLFNLELSAQTAQLYRQAGDATATATEFTYSTSTGGDKITYAEASTSSSNICAPAVRRLQVSGFTLNYKTSSIGKIVIVANSSGGTSSRTVTGLKVNGSDVFADVTINSTVLGNSGGGAGFSDCGEISITGLNVAKNETTGINLEFTFDGNVRINSINVWSTESLPLDFLSFAAKPDAFGKTVSLNWSTTNEVNTKNFEVQKRTDGTDFATIGTLASKNVAGIHNYAFTDNSASAGNSYYRIIQFDNDGSTTVSKIQAVSNKVSLGLSIYPNPTASVLNVSHSLAQAGSNVKVVSTDGKTVLQQALGLNTTDTKLDVSQLNLGSY
ncbi:MAG TPA: T9SS type A sorting domain-containing protein, partial [Pelobium sp.]|nr:T9SS type A sorting domain-containing protein [Pelobium sp.]